LRDTFIDTSPRHLQLKYDQRSDIIDKIGSRQERSSLLTRVSKVLHPSIGRSSLTQTEPIFRSDHPQKILPSNPRTAELRAETIRASNVMQPGKITKRRNLLLHDKFDLRSLTATQHCIRVNCNRLIFKSVELETITDGISKEDECIQTHTRYCLTQSGQAVACSLRVAQQR
jgi:hypothetical protein